MVSGETSPEPRVQALDGLRGLACIAVLAFHYLYRGPGLYPELGPTRWWAAWGQYGVDLFFVLSGFVIIMTLQRSTLRRFVLSRAVRLYPVYWVCVAITFAVVAVLGLPGREVTVGEALLNLTMLQEFLQVRQVDGAYWTLTVELSFYVLCGIALAVGAVSGRRLDVVLAVFLASALAAQAYNAAVNSDLADILLRAFGWLPLFVIGIVLHGFWSGDRRLYRWLLLVPAVLVPGIRDPLDALAAVVVGSLVAFALWGPRVGLATRPLLWLGAISFALYLLHQNIGYVALRALDGILPQVVAAVVVGVVMIGAAALLTYAFDIPVRRVLRRRLLATERNRGT